MSWDPFDDEPPLVLRPMLTAGAAVFGAASRMRAYAFDAGLLSAQRVDAPVISVGNVSVGGSGKTPFTALLANRLSANAVAIVSRGYGRRDKSKSLVVVSRGEGPIAAVAECGDEPTLLAERTSAIVVVCADRVRGAVHAISELGAQIILLDDGFQHRRLARDVDFVLVDARRPIGNGSFLPRGPLREPWAALDRATAIVVNHGDVFEEAVDPLLAERPRIDVVVMATPSRAIDGQAVAALSAIARPARFAETVRRLGAEVVHFESPPDHAWFDDAFVERFREAAARVGATTLVTTEKDAVRLGAHREHFVTVGIEHRVVRGEELLTQVLDTIRTRVGGAAVE